MVVHLAAVKSTGLDWDPVENLRILISSFVDNACWLHFKYDRQLKTDTTVTQYYNCKNGPLPISTEDPLTGNY